MLNGLALALLAVVARHASDPVEAVRLREGIHLVENGLGGGNEIAGGSWALIIGGAALATGLLSRPLGWFSLLIGVSGLATIVPGRRDTAGAIFGLGYIAWFVRVGLALWRRAGGGSGASRAGGGSGGAKPADPC